MFHKIQIEHSSIILESPNLNEDEIFLNIALSVVRQLSIEEVKNLFNLSIVYGNETELKQAYFDKDHEKINIIQHLIRCDKFAVKGSIQINPK